MGGFQRFDPEQWEPEHGDRGAAKVAKVAKVEAPADALPGTVSAGLAALDGDKVPHGLDAAAWREAVEDARCIASEGWAAKALGLGWSALDLFGGVPEVDGDSFGDGLAVWLSGRRLVALSADRAAAMDDAGRRHYFQRPRGKGARLLWALSRGR